MSRSLILLVLATGCGRINFDDIDPFPDLAFRKAITLTPPATMTEVVDEIPIHLGFADGDLAARVRGDGDDLLLAEADGSRLDWELVDYDSATGTVDAWVRIPFLEPGEPTTIYLHYGGKPHSRTVPWTSRFAGVWHMNVDNAGTVTDGVGNHDAATPGSNTAPAVIPGLAGTAADFDGVGDLLYIDDPPTGSLDFGVTSFSYSVWAFQAAPLGEYDTPFHKGGSSLSNEGYDFELGAGPWTGCLSDGAQIVIGDIFTPGSALGRWNQLTVVVDRPAQRARYYGNGVEQDTESIVTLGSLDNPDPLTFGRNPFPYRGSVDEIRIYRGTLTPSWIAVEYANLADREAFHRVGREQRF